MSGRFLGGAAAAFLLPSFFFQSAAVPDSRFGFQDGGFGFLPRPIGLTPGLVVLPVLKGRAGQGEEI